MPLSIISFFTYNEGLTSNHDVRPFFSQMVLSTSAKSILTTDNVLIR